MSLIEFLILIAIVGAVAWLGWWIQPKPRTIEQLCNDADKLAGFPWPMDPLGQIEWAMRMVANSPGTPSAVEDVVTRRIWCALANYRREPPQPEYIPMLAALRRAQERLQADADAYPADDYDASFPVDDAMLIGEAIEIVKSHIPTIDLDRSAWDAIKEAAGKSTWIPEQYFMNDWVSDVCKFLIEGDGEDGQRWRALMNGRVRVIGSAGLYPNTRCEPGYAHIGLELWTKQECGPNEPPQALELLTKYADIGRGVQLKEIAHEG